MPAVIYEKKDQVAYITLNRPEALNAFNDGLNDALGEAFADYRDDPDMLVAILTGNGRAFSVGADLKEMAARGQVAGDRKLNYPMHVGVWKPIIAAIDGFALAGGFNIALECDIRIATENSSLGNLSSRLGTWTPPVLTRMIPYGKALYIVLTGNRITAQEAHHAGLVHKVLPNREALMKEAHAIAEDIKMCAPLATQAIRKLAYTSLRQPWEEVEALSRELKKQVANSEDAKEGPLAFAQKRKPVWKAR